MKKIVSFSLWGDNPKYTVGALKNAALVSKLLSDWNSRFYCSNNLNPDIVKQLEDAGAEIVFMDAPENLTGMFWRFLVFEDKGVERAIIRDTDSRIDERDVWAIREWEKDGTELHVIRDHPFHSRVIMGGMWGAKSDNLRTISLDIEKFKPVNVYDSDQRFLEEFVYFKLKKFGITVHDEFYCYEANSKKIDIPRKEFSFIGEVYSATDVRENDYQKIVEHFSGQNFNFILKIIYFKIRYFFKDLFS